MTTNEHNRKIETAIATIILTLATVPQGEPVGEGPVYAALMTKGIELAELENMLRALAGNGYLTRTRGHGLTLEPKGRELAKKLATALESVKHPEAASR